MRTEYEHPPLACAFKRPPENRKKKRHLPCSLLFTLRDICFGNGPTLEKSRSGVWDWKHLSKESEKSLSLSAAGIKKSFVPAKSHL